MRLSVCVPLLDRSRTEVGPLFPNCLESVAKAGGVDEVVVADFGSTDWHPREWIGDVLGEIPWRLVTVPGPFARGRGLNVAARAAEHDALLFLDADMLISREVVEYAKGVAEAGAAYFPICWSLGNPAGSYGWWRKKGWGNCAMSRETWQAVGGWKEHERWGGEDDAMRDALAVLGVSILRHEVEGFIHQFHPKRMRHALASTI